MQFVHLATMAASRSDSYGVYWSARHYAARHALANFIAGSISAGLGGYHAGIEYGFWAGPAGCTANLALDGDIKTLTQQLLVTPLVRCDEAPWSFFGLSMAGWNALISLDIIAVALISLRRV